MGDDDDDDPWIGDPTMINISGFQPLVCYIALKRVPYINVISSIPASQPSPRFAVDGHREVPGSHGVRSWRLAGHWAGWTGASDEKWGFTTGFTRAIFFTWWVLSKDEGYILNCKFTKENDDNPLQSEGLLQAIIQHPLLRSVIVNPQPGLLKFTIAIPDANHGAGICTPTFARTKQNHPVL